MSVLAPEVVTRTALLGIQFWDDVTGRVIADGLTLTESRTGQVAIANSRGVFVLHTLPGLTASAFGAGDQSFWSSPPAQATIRLELTDAAGRFVAFSFPADAPSRGLFTDYCGLASPPEAVASSVPLYSTAARPVPAGAAVVRADLWDVVAAGPAAWAVLEVSAGGQVFRGVAGPDGRAVVLFPYPEPSPALGSPPAPGGLSAQTWSVSVTVRYAPATVTALSPPASPAGSAEALPDLCSVLEQGPGTLLQAASSAVAVGPLTLLFGSDLVLHSAAQSVQLVMPEL